jgi:uncharacterized protein
MKRPPSPCITVCKIDPASNWCTGCLRTLREIADWPMMTATQQRELLRALELRKGSTPAGQFAKEVS